MDKRAKTFLAYVALVLTTVLLLVFITQIVIAYSGGDTDLSIEYRILTENTVGVSYTPICFADCHLPFCVSYQGNTAPELSSINKEDVSQEFNFADGSNPENLNSYGINYLTTEVYYETIYDYGDCTEEIYNNITGENEKYSYSCVIGNHEEERTREVWKPLSELSQIDISKNKEICFDIWGKITPGMNEEFAVDVIPKIKLENKEFSLSEMAWWEGVNTDYRRPLYVNQTTGSTIRNILVPINVSSCFSNSSNIECGWFLLPDLADPSSTNYLYYNSLSDYYTVNETGATELLSTTTFGNRSYNAQKSQSMHRSAYTPFAVYFNRSVVDFSGNYEAGIVSGITYNNSEECLYGPCSTWDSIADRVKYQTINTGEPHSIEIMFKLNSWPSSIRTFVNHATMTNRWGGIYITTNNRIMTGQDSPCNNGAQQFSDYNITQLNKWYYVIVTRSAQCPSATQKIYIEGIQSGSDATVCNQFCSVCNWTIGSENGGMSFDSGQIAFVRYINKTLSADEIKARYEIFGYNYSTLGAEDSQISENSADNAIKEGIEASVLSLHDYTPYPEQQLYTRNITGQQEKGTFDYVVESGSQRWAFNYITSGDPTSPHTNVVNMTPVLYVWEAEGKTLSQITEEVKSFINSTWQGI